MNFSEIIRETFCH